MAEYLTDEEVAKMDAEVKARMVAMLAAVEAALEPENDRIFRIPVSDTTEKFWSVIGIRDDMPVTEMRDNLDRILKHSPDAKLGKMFSWLYALTHDLKY